MTHNPYNTLHDNYPHSPLYPYLRAAQQSTPGRTIYTSHLDYLYNYPPNPPRPQRPRHHASPFLYSPQTNPLHPHYYPPPCLLSQCLFHPRAHPPPKRSPPLPNPNLPPTNPPYAHSQRHSRAQSHPPGPREHEGRSLCREPGRRGTGGDG